jgi:hypothetical protein
LLEAQLQDVTRFEQGEQRQPADRALAGMRSELLAAANGKILELETDLLVSRQMPCTTSCAVLTQLSQPCFDSQDAQVLHSTAAFKRDREFGVLETQNIALREELQKLSDQLAQRTVLYAAQERRWKEGSKVSCLPITTPSRTSPADSWPDSAWTLCLRQSHEQSHSSLRFSLQSTQARLEQLQEMFSRSEADKLEALLALQQHASAEELLRTELRDSRESLLSVEQDLSVTRAQLSTMQLVVERLRGSDVSDVETEMAREMDVQVQCDSTHRQPARSPRLTDSRTNRPVL